MYFLRVPSCPSWFKPFILQTTPRFAYTVAAMPTITALLHTHNDALRLGRALEMLFPCDEILVIDHDSEDDTAKVAREYGARVLQGEPEVSYLHVANREWIFSLDPRESISEALAASLFEWKSEAIPANVRAYSVYRREETSQGWIENPTAQTRLVRSDWNRWQGPFPIHDASSIALEGELLHFVFP
jgi:glycosyltransferase involved in cell wall biosynthesis